MTFDILVDYVLEGVEYPEAKGNDVGAYAGDIDWKGKIVKMTPDRFLELAAPIPENQLSQKSLENLKSRMEQQLPIDPLVLVVDMEKKKVTGHEGRHRAIMAKRMGIEIVPVLIFTGSGYARTPRWTPEQHAEVDAANFTPEKS